MAIFSFSQEQRWRAPQRPEVALAAIAAVISERDGKTITHTPDTLTAKLGSRPALTFSAYRGSFYTGELAEGRVRLPLKAHIRVSPDGDGTAVEATLRENAPPTLMIIGPLRQGYRQVFTSLFEALISATAA
jgi:hypothetical protein